MVSISLRNTMVMALGMVAIAIMIPRSSASYGDDELAADLTEFNPAAIAGSDELMVQNHRRELAIVPNVLYYCRLNRVTRRRSCNRVISLGRIKVRRPIKSGRCRALVRRRRYASGLVTVQRVGQLCRFKPRTPPVLPPVVPTPPTASAPSPSDLEDLVPPVVADVPPMSAPLPVDDEDVVDLAPEAAPSPAGDDLGGMLLSPESEPFPV